MFTKRSIFSFLLVICLLAALLPFAANAAKSDTKKPDATEPSTTEPSIANPKEAFIQIDNTLLTATEGGEAVYALTDDDGEVITLNANADNYNIKYEYPAGGIPTLSLRNAKIAGKYHAIESLQESAFSVHIVVEGDSLLTATQQGIAWHNGDVTISGEGRLTIQSAGIGICLRAFTAPGSLTLQEAKLDIFTSLGQASVSVTGGDVLINGGEVNLSCTSHNGLQTLQFQKNDNVEYKLSGWEKTGNVTVNDCLFTAIANTDGVNAAGNLVFNGGVVNVTGGNRAIMTEGDFSITGGTIALVGNHAVRKAVCVGDDKTFSITGGIVEIVGNGGVLTESSVPSMVGHKGFTAYGGISKDTAGPYNKKLATEYQYFLLTAGTTIDDGNDENDTEPTETTDPEETTVPEETTEATTEETTEVTTEETTEETTGETTEATENTQETTGGTEVTETTDGTQVTETTGEAEETTEPVETTQPEDSGGKPVKVKSIVIGVLSGLAVICAAATVFVIFLPVKMEDSELSTDVGDTEEA